MLAIKPFSNCKRKVLVRERPGNGLDKARSIRSEFRSSPIPLGYNYLNFSDIPLLLKYYYYSKKGASKIDNYRLECAQKNESTFLKRPPRDCL